MNRDLKLEITRLTSQITFLEQSNLSVEQDLYSERKKTEEILETKEIEINSLQEKLRMKINECDYEAETKNAEIESFTEQLNAKQLFINKLEQSFHADNSRLEKKVAAQVREKFNFFIFLLCFAKYFLL
jgi:chromosome segregation ATPase